MAISIKMWAHLPTFSLHTIMRKLHTFILLFSLFFSAFCAAQSPSRSFECKVIGISDGDTLTCLFERKPIKVRLLHIDAPESHQAFGNRAKQTLAELVFKKHVQVISKGYDKYDRLLAEVYESNQNINLILVEKGMAWAYSKSLPIYEQAEANARQNRIGLWQDANPISPSDWRKQQRAQSTLGNGLSKMNTFPQAINCQAKLSCSDFRDFESANRYFQTCHAKDMDGNRDGIPCNRLYRKQQRP